MKRFLVWLFIAVVVLLCPVAIYWMYVWYARGMGAFSTAFPRIYSAFSFLIDMLVDGGAISTGIAGLLATLLVYGALHLVDGLAGKICPTRFGGRYFFFGIVSALITLVGIGMLIYAFVTLHLSLIAFIRYWDQDVFLKILAYTTLAELVFSFMLLIRFEDISSYKLLLGGKKRTVFIGIPRDANAPFRYKAYIASRRSLIGEDGSLDGKTLQKCCKKAASAFPSDLGSDFLIGIGKIERKDTVSLQDFYQIHIDPESKEVYLNHETFFCTLLRALFTKYEENGRKPLLGIGELKELRIS